MPSVTIRNLPVEVHQALRARAERSGRSTEAEIRDILQKAALPNERPRLGSLLVSIGREANLSDDEVMVFETLRDKTPVGPLDLG